LGPYVIIAVVITYIINLIIAFHRCSHKRQQLVAAAAGGADRIPVPRALVARTCTTARLCTCTEQLVVRTLAAGIAAVPVPA